MRLIWKATIDESILGGVTKDLSPETLDEILDFIKFKKLKMFEKRSFQKKIDKELNDLGETSLTHLEEEFHNHKELYPREQ